jgi:membrane-bound lytic murein transglycosylase B
MAMNKVLGIAALMAVGLTTACGGSPASAVAPEPSAGMQQQAAAPAVSLPNPAQSQDFAAFLDRLRAEARDKGIRAETVETALAGVQHIDKVIELDRKQPEFTMTFDTYMSRVVSPEKVAKGRARLAENRALLAEIEQRYGVQPRFVVALWGIETDYGRVTGGYPIVSSLATLAFDGRRSAYFKGELMNALTIVDQGHIKSKDMIGSWAGAMGQCQFMPSSFLKFAEDWDGDGRRDIWTTRGDVLASAANYLGKSGWQHEQTWGRPVRLPAGFDAKLIGLDTRKSLAEWSRLGVKSGDGKALPHKDLQASVVLAETGKGPAFLVYDNFRTIMKWNRSTFFALAAGHLADRIGGK